ncbi:MAG: hypothetical protein ABIH83_04830 [Candidatus Micrarchaeota archaeon]
MKNLIFYSDGFGWGHVTRDAALVRKWADENKEGGVYWRVGKSVADVCKKLAQGRKNVIVMECKEGIGFAAEGIGVNKEESKTSVNKWLGGAEKKIREEAEFLKKINADVVLSDIGVEGIYAAEKAGVKCFAVSNFTWKVICKDLWKKWEELHNFLDRGYELADASFILPLSGKCEELPNKINTPFLVREMTDGGMVKSGKNKIAKFAFGKSVGKFGLPKLPKGWEKALPVPEKEIDGQNYIKGADVVLAKAAYGACSEAVQAGVPSLVCEREGFVESKDIAEGMVRNGWGWNIPLEKMEEFLEKWEERGKWDWKGAEFDGAEFIIKKLEEIV